MSPQRWLAAVALLGAIAAAVGAGAGAAETDERTVEIEIRYSQFGPAAIRVPVGVPIRFVLVNADPIDHEWIVGDAAVHERHRTGTEPTHGARPTEQAIAAGATVETIVTFETPGTFNYICHLPQHEAYGMVGTIVVR
jgi:plastocyanin